MATAWVERRLAAILVADVVGYSRLVEQDEAGTLAALKDLRREVIDQLLGEHHGRIVKLMGDGAIAEFGSVVDAVACGVAVQKGVAERQIEVAAERRIVFRIGINLGDVVVEGDDLLGDGVNIAARLEQLCEPGSVLISGTAYDQLQGKLDLPLEFVGEQHVKNIERSIRTYRVPSDGVARQSRPWIQLRHQRLAAALVLGAGLLTAGVWWLWPYHPSAPEQLTSASSIGQDGVPSAGGLARVATPGSGISRSARLPISDKPPLAVLPFTAMGGEPDLGYFGEGIAEDLMTRLSQYPDLLVTGRNSTFFYKGKSVPTRQIAEELGVRYVLEGSVRKSNSRVRITAQLIDGRAGHHVWADQYDEEGEDVFALQDQVTRKVASALGGERGQIRQSDYQLVWSKGAEYLEDYDYALRMHSLLYRFTRDDTFKARALGVEALQRFPNSGFLRIKLGWTYFSAVLHGWSNSPEEDLKEAFRLTSEGMAGADALPPIGRWHGHWLLSFLYLRNKHDIDAALAELEATLRLAPHDTDTLLSLSEVLLFAGHYDYVIESFRKAEEIDPRIPDFYFSTLGAAYHFKGQNELALAKLKRVVKPDVTNLQFRASAFVELGRQEEAREAVAEMLRANPPLTVDLLRKTLPLRDTGDLERHLAGIRRAGLPEG